MKTILLILLSLGLSAQTLAQTCSLPRDQYDKRIRFLEEQIRMQKDKQKELEKAYKVWNENLEAMKTAHKVATVSAIISAAALTAVGASIGWTTLIKGNSVVAFGSKMVFATRASATAMMAGEVIEISKGMIGMTYFFLARTAVMLPADAYFIYKDLFGNHTDFGASVSPETMKRIAGDSKLYTPRALAFLSDPNWSGSSDELNNPMFNKALKEISDWQAENLKEIGDSWAVFEYFTKDYLEQSAVNAQAYRIAADIGRFQLFYWNGLLSLLKHEKIKCLTAETFRSPAAGPVCEEKLPSQLQDFENVLASMPE